ISMVKAHVSRMVLTVLDRTIQVCGALGYSGDLPVEGWYRGTRFGTIGDGPDEVHKSVVARTVLKDYRPVDGWPTEHIPSRRPAALEKWSERRAAAGLPPAAGRPWPDPASPRSPRSSTSGSAAMFPSTSSRWRAA